MPRKKGELEEKVLRIVTRRALNGNGASCLYEVAKEAQVNVNHCSAVSSALKRQERKLKLSTYPGWFDMIKPAPNPFPFSPLGKWPSRAVRRSRKGRQTLYMPTFLDEISDPVTGEKILVRITQRPGSARRTIEDFTFPSDEIEKADTTIYLGPDVSFATESRIDLSFSTQISTV